MLFRSQAKSELKAGPAGIEGTRTWEFVVVPETSGTLGIPELPFSYFDPSTETINHAHTASLSLQVAGAGSPGEAPAVAAQSVRAPARGPLALRSDLDPAARFLPAAGGRVVGWALALALALHGGLWAGSRLTERRARDAEARAGAFAPRSRISLAPAVAR